MKILITILLALFLSSNASANSIKKVCEYQEREIINTYIIIEDNIRIRSEYLGDPQARDVVRQINERIDRVENNLKEEAKTYHYLDCSDFR
tara:strand:- start:215 stop:487 length:273 start_codon:yes stop_codon:yes gene_type:complete